MGVRLILASGSPYRRALLDRLRIPFEVIVSHVDETGKQNEDPSALALRLSIAKARAVAMTGHNGLIIGSDQVAVYDGEIVGKPKGFAEAKQQLQRISGKKATLYTGLAVFNTRTEHLQTAIVPFSVVFRTLTNAHIEKYLKTEEPYDCAGSVKSEGLGIALFERFDGDDPTTLIGLPLIRLIRMLENEGLDVLDLASNRS